MTTLICRLRLALTQTEQITTWFGTDNVAVFSRMSNKERKKRFDNILYRNDSLPPPQKAAKKI